MFFFCFFLDFSDFFRFLNFLDFFGYFFKFLRLLPKDEGRSPPQELEEGPRSGPHLLVTFKTGIATASEPIPLE